MSKSILSELALENINKSSIKGPFDIIGDVHGCWDELQSLLERTGYVISKEKESFGTYVHPKGRRLVFVGDLCDRGPKSLEVLNFALTQIKVGTLFTLGNHDYKLLRFLKGNKVEISHGLETTAGEFNVFLHNVDKDKINNCLASCHFSNFDKCNVVEKIKLFLSKLAPYYILDDNRLIVAHAGLSHELKGLKSNKALRFSLYGDITGNYDIYGMPERRNWPEKYNSSTIVVYGHTPCLKPKILNNTYNIDTGCVFGNMLTCLRYPEMELVQVNSLEQYFERTAPLDC